MKNMSLTSPLNFRNIKSFATFPFDVDLVKVRSSLPTDREE